MSVAVANLDAALAMLKRDFLIARTYRLRYVSQTAAACFTLVLFYYISRMVQVEAFGSPDAYFAFVVVGMLILQTVTSTLGGPPGAVQGELMTGTFERLLVSPFGAVGSIFSMMVYPFVHAVLTGFAMLVFAWLVFGLPVAWSTAWLAVPVALLAALAFAPLGAMLASSVIVMKHAVVGSGWIIAAISVVAGLYFPVALLPEWIRWASDAQPFTPAVELLRHVLVGTSLTGSAWLDAAKLVGFAAVLLPLAAWTLRAAVRAGRRSGAIVEY